MTYLLKEDVLAYAKRYRGVNKNKLQDYQKKYRATHKDSAAAYHREYNLLSGGKKASYNQKYSRTHKKENLAYLKRKYLTDIHFRLAKLLRTRLWKAIRRGSKGGSAVRDLGCTILELKFYLEGQFQDGMTWNNWSPTGWHIDHKIPLDFYDLTDREQLLQAVHYTNLQPLWAGDNLRKGKKFDIAVWRNSTSSGS
mgnify:CR=1 FL=1